MNIRKLIFIIAGLFLLGAIGGTVVTLLSKPSARAERKSPEKESKLEEFTAVPLEEFLVNLADRSESHYLKTVVVLELDTGQEGEEHIKLVMPQVRDAIITTMSKKRYTELLTEGGKQSLKKDIKNDVNRVMKEDIVSGVYFTSFAMQ